MAAGRIDVSRRRGFFDEFIREDHDSDHSVVHSNGFCTSSAELKIAIRRSGFSCASKGLDLWGGCRVDRDRGYEAGEIPKDEGGVSMPPRKKRKRFSPIIWDLDDKLVKISLESRVAHASAKSVAPSLVRAQNDREQGQGVEEEFAEARNISTSQRACENVFAQPVYDMSSSGSCELTREVSGRDLSRRVSGSDRCNHSVLSISREENFRDKSGSDEPMDCEEMQEKGADFSQKDSDDNQFEDHNAAGRSVNMLQSCRSVLEFERLDAINEGTYGKVYKARGKRTGELVALKKFKMHMGSGSDRLLEEYGFPITALREINILLSFRHPSIVSMKEVVVDDLENVFMVMEYMEHDLKGFMRVMKYPFSTSEVKCLMLQFLEGISSLHDNWVIHRDLKTSNLLLNNQGDLKICDFGMSRQYGSQSKPYSDRVVTLWYRAPELLLGVKKYSTAVDMWSVGCIMAELLAKKPLFEGKKEVDQLDKIFGILGNPNEKIWPGLSRLPGAKANFVKQPCNLLRKKFPAASFTGSAILSNLGFDLLNRLLTYDPNKRISAYDALNHAWFREVPLPQAKELMPSFPHNATRKHLSCA